MLNKIIFICLLVSIVSYIIMPFYTYKENNIYNISDYYSIKTFTNNIIYSSLIIGTPPQKITANINFNDYAFNIYNNQCDIPSEYNSISNNSTTRNNKGYILTDVYVDTFLLEDIFSFPQYPDKSFNLNYIFAPMNNNIFESNIEKKNFTCANIGLKLSVDYPGTFDYNFLRELKSLNLIDNYVFYIYYIDTTKEEGNLVIGKFPHEIDKTKYDIKQYKEIYALNNKFNLRWMFEFDKIILNFNNNNIDKYNITDKLEAEIDYNLNAIYGTKEFRELIENNYFKNKIESNICKKISLTNKNLIFYECQISLDLKTFPEIKFIHKGLSANFILTYKDIFIPFNDKYVFLIFFDTHEDKNLWKLGKPFLKKYLFTFDLDKKNIGYYSDKKDSNLTNKEPNSEYKYIIINICILSIIAFVLCFIITKCYYKYKKQNANDNKKLTELIYMNEEAVK